VPLSGLNRQLEGYPTCTLMRSVALQRHRASNLTDDCATSDLQRKPKQIVVHPPIWPAASIRRVSACNRSRGSSSFVLPGAKSLWETSCSQCQSCGPFLGKTRRARRRARGASWSIPAVFPSRSGTQTRAQRIEARWIGPTISGADHRSRVQLNSAE
jgi:hypothetical protein